MSGGRPSLRPSKLGEGATAATMNESGENTDIGRTKPVLMNVARHHSPPEQKSKTCKNLANMRRRPGRFARPGHTIHFIIGVLPTGRRSAA